MWLNVLRSTNTARASGDVVLVMVVAVGCGVQICGSGRLLRRTADDAERGEELHGHRQHHVLSTHGVGRSHRTPGEQHYCGSRHDCPRKVMVDASR